MPRQKSPAGSNGGAVAVISSPNENALNLLRDLRLAQVPSRRAAMVRS
jgi:hypothetical protein